MTLSGRNFINRCRLSMHERLAILLSKMNNDDSAIIVVRTRSYGERLLSLVKPPFYGVIKKAMRVGQPIICETSDGSCYYVANYSSSLIVEIVRDDRRFLIDCEAKHLPYVCDGEESDVE